MRTPSKPVLIGAGAVVASIAALLAFGVFGVHTLFIDDEVGEANPFAVTTEAAPVPDEPVAADVEPSLSPEPPAEAEEPEVVTLTRGEFAGNSRYTTVGHGLTITDGTTTFLRFEQFETDNGPDLNVYLRNSDVPDDYIDLGELKGNIGEQNYELPADIDLDRYDVVDVWCVRFGVSFGSARLT